jgi:sigma-B regulation protein RsbU (phosphoserine phosphatase)
MDVRVVVRQGLRYALAKNGVAVLRALGIAMVIIMALRLSQEHAGLSTQTIAVAAGIALITGFGWLANLVGHWIDKRFFREQVRAEEILGTLAGDVHRIVKADALIETVAQSVAASLRVDRIAVWLLRGDDPVAAWSMGSGDWNIAPALAALRERNKAIVLNESLNQVGTGAEVALPIMARGRLLGAIVLGAKRSEQPYSRMELDVLEAVASHTALALENSLLASSLAEEAGQRERLNREVEIAREVQQRLLPQAGPAVAGLEYAGICRPALGVGGDYYDFLPLDDGRFGFAIGDVSGKGYAAALLMASLQASLRGQTLDSPDDLARLMARVNRLLFEATPSNKYATFFYSQYEPLSRRLDWVNAGHNAPLLFRGAEIHRLEEGGSVVGLFRDAQYTQGSIQLQTGDLLIAFTDGISEAMDVNDEEWGEDQLCAAVALFGNDMPVMDSVTRLLACADAHAAGAPQHDDMTVVAIRAVAAPRQEF